MRTRAPRALSPIVQTAIVLAIVAVALLAFFLFSLIGRRTHPVVVEATPAPLPSGYFRPTAEQWQSLTTQRVASENFADVSVSDGTIAPADDATAQIFSPFTGRVTNVSVTVGDAVRRGEALFSGEGDEYPQAQNDLAQAEQTLAAARTALAVSEKNRARLLKLLRYDAAARKDVEQSRADLANARVAVRNDEIAVSLVRSRLGVLGQPTQSNPASRTGPAQPLQTGVVVRAPIAGVVTQRAIADGQFVQSAASGGSTALLTITDLSRVFLVANITEADISRIHPGDRVDVKMQAYPDRDFDGTVRYIAPAVDPTTHRISVRAEVDNPDGSLKPGMFGSFRVFTGGGVSAVAVPESAVIFEGDTARVWITGPNRTLALRYVRAGKVVDGTVEILNGLRPGDRVVTTGSVFIDRASQGDD
jgi:cobalt-zinc-cadmium efflux system membrane fusion protein